MTTRPRNNELPRIWHLLGFFAVGYLCIYGLTFMADPLAQAPVLDARENLAWAAQIRAGTLPGEPFYRAMLYPWLLAQLPAATLPIAATLLGLLLHLGSACLYAIYPVALFFAGQVLDITLGTTLFLAGVYALILAAGWRAPDAASSPPERAGADTRLPGYGRILLALLAGLLAGLAVLARPNFLPAVLCFPLVACLARSSAWKVALASALGLAAMLAAQGWLNYKNSGEFRLLPWQGAYNLYAANAPGANGKYYTQRVAFEEVPAGANTTRMESEWLYRQSRAANDHEADPLSIDAMNAHWRAMLVDSVRADPAAWLGLMGRKLVYVLNDWEQYNNLSYAYHKARWPVLAWNPLGWGILALLAFTGIWKGLRYASRPALITLGLLALAYTVGLLLFFVSARFRLPLVPLLCVAAGGCAYWSHSVFSQRQRILFPVCLLALALLSFGNWWNARDRAPFIQDTILLAIASSQVGDDAQALELARQVMARDPERAEAQSLELTSLYNLWLINKQPHYWVDLEASLATHQVSDPAVAFIRGVAAWRRLQPEQAIEIWKSAMEQYGARAASCRQALRAVGHLPGHPAEAHAVDAIRALLDL
jgi:hypothetical protein